MKRTVLLVLSMLLCPGVSVNAACTPEQIQAKAQEFMNIAIALAQKDPQRYQSVAQALQNELPELHKAGDFEKICLFYDNWIAKMK